MGVSVPSLDQPTTSVLSFPFFLFSLLPYYNNLYYPLFFPSFLSPSVQQYSNSQQQRQVQQFPVLFVMVTTAVNLSHATL